MRNSEHQTSNLDAEFNGANPSMGDIYYESAPGRWHVYAMTAVGSPCVRIGYTADIDRRRDQISGPNTLDVRFVRDFSARAAAMFFCRRLKEKLALIEMGGGWYFACELQVLEAVRLIDRSVQ